MTDLPNGPKFPESCMTVSRRELLNLELNVCEGEIPQDISGHAFIIGPVGTVGSRTEDLLYPGGAGVSLYNGDGMVFRLDFNHKDQVSVSSRIIKTPCYYADLETVPGSKYANLGYFNLGMNRLSPVLGFRNEVNTALLPFKFSRDENWRVLATWDAGRPYEIDPISLETITPIGWIREWNEQKLVWKTDPYPYIFALNQTAAHPIFDIYTDELFMVNWSRSISTLQAPIIRHQVNTVFESNLLKKYQKIISALPQIFSYLSKDKGEDFVYLMCWDGSNEDIKKWKVVDADGNSIKIEQSMHQIGLTRDYIVLMDTSFKFGIEQLAYDTVPNDQGLETYRDILNYPQAPDTSLYLVHRADLRLDANTIKATRVEVPREIAHFTTDYENPDGFITLHCAHNNGWDPAEWIHDYDAPAHAPGTPIGHRLVGMTAGTTDINHFGKYVIEVASGQIHRKAILNDPEYTWATAIATFNETVPSADHEDIYWISWGCWKDLMTNFVYNLYASYKYRRIKLEEIKKIAEEGKPSSLCRLNTKTMKITDGYQFPPGYFGNSPQFIPRSGATSGSTDGYVLCLVLLGDDKSEIWIFDAKNLQAGPICKLNHPDLKFGLTIHTTWIPSAHSRIANYYIPVKEDYEDLISKQSTEVQKEIQEFFQEKIYPRFSSADETSRKIV
jgi:carotenoid cleavage dioxygenase-like enzyme